MKIDKDYTQKLGINREGVLHSTYGLILLALRLSSDYEGLRIVAEGVENKTLEKKLQKISFGSNGSKKHITHAQGFLYGEPQRLDYFINDIIYS